MASTTDGDGVMQQALFEAGVVVGRDSGQEGDLLATQAGDPPDAAVGG